jgi:hypothetical protein
VININEYNNGMPGYSFRDVYNIVQFTQEEAKRRGFRSTGMFSPERVAVRVGTNGEETIIYSGRRDIEKDIIFMQPVELAPEKVTEREIQDNLTAKIKKLTPRKILE